MLTCGAHNVQPTDIHYQLACLFRRFPAALTGAVQEMVKADSDSRDILLRVLFDLSNYQDFRDRLNMHLRHAEHISINRWSTTLHPHWRSIVCYLYEMICFVYFYGNFLYGTARHLQRLNFQGFDHDTTPDSQSRER